VARTPQGLTCPDDEDHGIHSRVGGEGSGLSLEAGSSRHRHVVAFEDPGKDGATHFALLVIDLPEEWPQGSRRSN
jgi:hypothetical protein